MTRYRYDWLVFFPFHIVLSHIDASLRPDIRDTDFNEIKVYITLPVTTPPFCTVVSTAFLSDLSPRTPAFFVMVFWDPGTVVGLMGAGIHRRISSVERNARCDRSMRRSRESP